MHRKDEITKVEESLYYKGYAGNRNKQIKWYCQTVHPATICTEILPIKEMFRRKKQDNDRFEETKKLF